VGYGKTDVLVPCGCLATIFELQREDKRKDSILREETFAEETRRPVREENMSNHIFFFQVGILERIVFDFCKTSN
jgi:hypothetical protein